MGHGELCRKLVQADSEKDAKSILEKFGYWDNPSVWRNYGDQENNWGTGGNQQDNPEAALVEKLINSVDAMLMRECLREGTNPEDEKSAPSSMKDAVHQYFGVRGGALETFPGSARTELAENIILMASGKGKTARPCITVIDKGEGQTPLSFKDTLLSLGKSNKVRINFVQGKFNQGGTGAISFCGEHGLQLIISRRDPQIHSPDDSSQPLWGFTIIRLFPPSPTMKNYIIKYLAPDNGEVLTFKEPLKLLPGPFPDKHSELLEWGTLIKLYDYELSTGIRSNIRIDLFFRLSLLLPRLALPIRMVERRSYDTDKYETTLAGLEVRLIEYGRDSLEPNMPYSRLITVQGEVVPCSIYVFQKTISKAYTKGEGVIFTQNGQTQAWLSNRMFLSEKVGLGKLWDSLLIIVNCDGISRPVVAKMFMGSRDRLRNNEFMLDFKEELRKAVKSDPVLKELNHRRMLEEKGESMEDDEEFIQLVEDLVKSSPGMDYLFNPGQKIRTPYDLREVGSTLETYEGKQWPDYFKLKSSSTKEVPQGSYFKMLYETDARNDYFDRADSPGQFSLIVDGVKAPVDLALWNGLATLIVHLPRKAQVTDVINYKSIITDEFNEWVYDFQATVTNPGESRKGGPSSRAKPPGENDSKRRREESTLDLPEMKEIRKPQWGTEYNDYTAVKAIPTPEEKYKLYINMDNIFLLKEIKRKQKKAQMSTKRLESLYKKGMYIITLGILQKGENTAIDIGDEEIITKGELVEHITRALSPVLMSLVLEV